MASTQAMSEERPVGLPVERLPSGRAPQSVVLEGRTMAVEPIDAGRHGSDLYASFAASDPDGALWTYMAYGPFTDEAAFLKWLRGAEASADPLFFALVPKQTNRASGMASYLRTNAAHGVTEIGNIWLAPTLQRTRAATEAIYLMMANAFDALGYRRFEWKCDALNAASRRAAERFGFSFEGVFAKHMIIKGRNRDTAWYAMTDDDWPRIRGAFETWLDDANFDTDGRQRRSLSELMRESR